MTSEFKYRAFISYSHQDRAWADWLHRRLESYRVPARLVGSAGLRGPVPKRIGRCFRDQLELSAASHLGATLQQALADAESLIVVCSPRSATSQWVNEEIRQFRRLGRASNIYALVVDGEPYSADPAQECFPQALCRADDGSALPEPLAADAREQGEGKSDSFLRLAAGLLGVNYDELRRRERLRRARFAALAIGLSLAVAVITTVLAITAQRARDEAQLQRQRAERVKNYVISVFQEQDPFGRDTAVARTPQQMIDDAAQHLDEELLDEPGLHAELLNELGGIQLSLGNNSSAETLLTRALLEREAYFGASSREVADTLTKLAAIRNDQLRYANAEALARRAVAILQEFDNDRLDLARAQRKLADSISFGKKPTPQAAELYQQSLRTFEELLGPDSKDSLISLNQLAQFHAQARDDQTAATQLLELTRRVERRYGSGSQHLYKPLVQLAQMQNRAGQPQQAIDNYQRAIANLRAAGVTHSAAMVVALSGMASAQRSLGRLDVAMQTYNEAEAAADRSDSASLGDILLGRGRVALLLGRYKEAERDLRAAYDLVRNAAGESNGRTWYFASQWGSALAALGDLKGAEKIQRQALERLGEIMGKDAYQNVLLLDALASTLEYTSQGRAEAETLRQRSLEIVESKYSKNHDLWSEYAYLLARNLAGAGTAATAESAVPLIENTLLNQRAQSSSTDKLPKTLITYAEVLATLQRREQAREAAQEALTRLAATATPDQKLSTEAKALLKRL